MKKLLISLSAVALTLLAFTAIADAGQYVRYIACYDHCGRPVYAYRYVPTPTYHHSSHGYCQPSYGHSSSYFRPSGYPSVGYHSYHSHSRPSYSFSYSRGLPSCR